jgi:rubredoxin
MDKKETEKKSEEKRASCPIGPPDWRYKCRKCHHVFILPAAKGPSEEKNRTCPKCGATDIERTDLVKSEACPPGG